MENVNKEGMEIMADLNLEIEELKEEVKMEKQENELYMDYLDVADAEEAKKVFETMKKQIADLERKNENLQESNNLLVGDSLKLKKKIYGDGLEYLLED